MIRTKIAKGLRTTATYIEIDYLQYTKWLLASAKKTWADAKKICSNEFRAYKTMKSHAFEIRNVEKEFITSSGADKLNIRKWDSYNLWKPKFK